MNNLKLISATLVLVLLISSFSSSYGIIEKFENHEKTELTNNVQQVRSINPSFNILLSINDPTLKIKNQELVVVLHKTPTVSRNLILHEGIIVSNAKEDGSSIVLLKHDFNKAILQRIFNDRKYLLDDSIGLPLYYDTDTQIYKSIGAYLSDQIPEFLLFNFDQKILDQFLVLPLLTDRLSEKSDLDYFYNIRNTLLSATGTALHPSGPLLILFAFSAFAVIIITQSTMMILSHLPKKKIES